MITDVVEAVVELPVPAPNTVELTVSGVVAKVPKSLPTKADLTPLALNALAI